MLLLMCLYVLLFISNTYIFSNTHTHARAHTHTHTHTHTYLSSWFVGIINGCRIVILTNLCLVLLWEIMRVTNMYRVEFHLNANECIIIAYSVESSGPVTWVTWKPDKLNYVWEELISQRDNYHNSIPCSCFKKTKVMLLSALPVMNESVLLSWAWVALYRERWNVHVHRRRDEWPRRPCDQKECRSWTWIWICQGFKVDKLPTGRASLTGHNASSTPYSLMDL